MPVEYELVHVNRVGHERRQPAFLSETELQPGAILRHWGRDWIVDRVDGRRVELRPARYRLRLRHPDGREELGAVRRYRADAPRVGHTFSTLEDGTPVSWQVADERLARDEQGGPYLDLTAERDYSERDEPPSPPEHELEHAQAREEQREAVEALLAQTVESGVEAELVALEPGEAPDWTEAEAYIDALGLEEIEDDLLEQCGVDPARDPRERWLDTVKQRLREDLGSFRDDVEGDQDEIEEWDFREGRIFAAAGTYEDESSPDSGFGRLARLVDSGALAAAGFSRVRRAELDV
jgi:hypothetical protein